MNNEKVASHIGIRMDGNGRWATSRGKRRSAGHLEGSKTLQKLAIHALKRGIKILSVFAFSTENFSRSEEEVEYLMNLIVNNFKREVSKFKDNNIKVLISGRSEKLRNEYERKYGPLSLSSPSNDVYPFAWINGPWPWEGR